MMIINRAPQRGQSNVLPIESPYGIAQQLDDDDNKNYHRQGQGDRFAPFAPHDLRGVAPPVWAWRRAAW
jgi:hypothetical protein